MIVTADDHKPFHDVLAATTLHHLIPPSSPGSCKLITIRTIEIIFIWNNFLSLMPSLSPVSGVSPPWSHGPVSVPRSWCWYWPGYVSQSHHCIKHYHLIIPVNCSLNQLNIDKWKVCHWLIVSHRSVQCCCGPGHMYQVTSVLQCVRSACIMMWWVRAEMMTVSWHGIMPPDQWELWSYC